jgi:tyrosyl-tRNA synthetase
MNINEKLELIGRNAAEIVTKKELRSLLERKQRPIVYCRYEPSGPVFETCKAPIYLVDSEKALECA